MTETPPNNSLVRGICDGNLAYVLALSSSVITKENAQELIRGLLELRAESEVAQPVTSIGAWKESLNQRLGVAAEWLKADRSDLEMAGVGFLLAIRGQILDLANLHLRFAETMIALAAEHRDTLIPNPGAQANGAVSTLGHSLLTYVYPVFRDLERLQHCYRNFNTNPSGAGKSATGARLTIDRDRMRSLLGFDETRTHTGDALWQADGPIELMAAIVALLVNLNRLTDDLRSWATADYSAEAAGVRSLTSSLLAKVPELASLGKEFGENPECFVIVSTELHKAFEGTNRTIKGLIPFVQRNAESAETSQQTKLDSVAQTDLIEVIVIRGGVGQSTAQAITRELERLVANGEIDLTSLTPEAVDVVAIQVTGMPLHLTEADLASAVIPSEMVAARVGIGGVGPARVTEMITECRARLVRESLWVSTAGQRLANSEALLAAETQDAAGR